MLDKVLINIAQEHNMKITEDSIFGVYNGQLINLAFANNQYVAIIGLKEDKSLEVTLSTKENKKFLKQKLKSAKLSVQKEAILFSGIHCGLIEKSRESKLKYMLDELCVFLRQFQNFDSTAIENVVLIGMVPVIRSDEVISKAKIELKQEREKQILHHKGFLASSLGIIFVAAVAGLASGLGNVKANSDLNAFGKAFLSLGMASFLYGRVAKGIDLASKWFIGFSATLGFIAWEISRYATILKYRGQEFTFYGLVELFQNNINTETIVGRFTLISLVAIWIGVILFVKRTDSVKFVLTEGELLSSDKIKEFELISKGNWYSGLLFIVGLFALFFSGMLMASVYENVSYFEYLPLIYVSLISHTVFWFLFKTARKKVTALNLTMKTYGLSKMPGWYDPLMTHFLLAFFSISIAFCASWANMKFDSTYEKTVSAKLLEEYSNSHECQWLDVEPEGMDKLSMRICKYNYGFLDKNIKGIINYRNGYLNIPYALDVSFPPLETYKKYVEATGGIKGLKQRNILHFYQKDKSKEFMNIIKGWEKLCETDNGAYCRFAAYIYGEKKEIEKEISFLKKGCQKQDAVSCYGLVLHEKINDKEKDEHVLKMESSCDSDEGENCHYLGHSYENYKSIENKEKISALYSKACKLGVKEACDH